MASVPLTPLFAADTARLWALDQRCFPPGIAYSQSEIREVLLQSARGFHAAIEIAGLVVSPLSPPAAFLLSLLRRGRGHIITLDVAPEHRRRGLGLTLMLAAERHYAARHATGMRLEAAVDNAGALAFYARLGYRILARLPNYYRPGQDAFRLEKDLP